MENLKEVGLDAIQEHEQKLIRRLIDGLKRFGQRLAPSPHAAALFRMYGGFRAPRMRGWTSMRASMRKKEQSIPFPRNSARFHPRCVSQSMLCSGSGHAPATGASNE